MTEKKETSKRVYFSNVVDSRVILNQNFQSLLNENELSYDAFGKMLSKFLKRQVRAGDRLNFEKRGDVPFNFLNGISELLNVPLYTLFMTKEESQEYARLKKLDREVNSQKES